MYGCGNSPPSFTYAPSVSTGTPVLTFPLLTCRVREIEAEEAQDPLLHTVRLMDGPCALTPAAALAIYEETEARVGRIAAEVITRPRLRTAAEVMAHLIPPRRVCQLVNSPSAEARTAAFGGDLKVMAAPQIMSRLINWALTDLMLTHGEIVLMGEDIGRKGGVYGVTQKLGSRFGRARVIDTLLDEQSILGLGIGMAHNGSCQCQRSSFWPISTMPRISSVARRRLYPSSPRGNTPIPWSSGLPDWAIKRASAAIFTTTIRSRCCVIYPG